MTDRKLIQINLHDRTVQNTAAPDRVWADTHSSTVGEVAAYEIVPRKTSK